MAGQFQQGAEIDESEHGGFERRETMPNTTQRAYTLRLEGYEKNDNYWRDALWNTHEAVNKGTKVFGDWLLTLRGGLDHNFANASFVKGAGKSDTNSIEALKKRRIFLALSWLSVESELGAPENYIVAKGSDPSEERNRKVIAALKEILEKRGVNSEDIDKWVSDCSASLCAEIRDDAVWVNRSRAFDDRSLSCSLFTREDAWDILKPFFGSPEAYLSPITISEDESSEQEQEEKVKNLVKKAGQWLSSRFGKGKGADFRLKGDVYHKIAQWAEDNAKQGKSASISDLENYLRTHIDINSLEDKVKKALENKKGLDWIIAISSYTGHTPNPVHDLLKKNSSLNSAQLDDLSKKANKRAKSCTSKIGSKTHKSYADLMLKDVETACGFNYLGHGKEKTGHFQFAVMLDHAARRVSAAHTWIKRAEAEREKFENDAKRIQQVPANVKKWLDDYCHERSQESGAITSYRIRRRAINGWEKIVSEWSKPDCRTAADRINIARALQDDPEIEKGDIQLFESLAEDDAMCVWHQDGDPSKAPDPKPLIDYVLATEAEFKKRQFKVPIYRHPDTLLHPVFCEFGVSRWNIKFNVLENIKGGKTCSIRGLSMTLWNGKEMKDVPLRWHSKRFMRDLVPNSAGVKEVTRADRLGLAASNASKHDKIKIASIFEQGNWNARLQSPRQQLEDIARHVKKHGWDEKATKMKNHIRWFITFSPKLQPFGPWRELDKNNYSRLLNTENKNRKGKARLILARIPDLRVLSVDLGHRYAAACSIWVTISADAMARECVKAKHQPPTPDDVFIHLKTFDEEGKEKTIIYRRIGPDTLPDGTAHPAPWARLERQFLIKLQGEAEGAREASNEELFLVHQMEEELGRRFPLLDRLIASGWGGTDKQKARLEELKKMGWIPIEKGMPKDEHEEEEEPSLIKPSLSVDELMFSTIRVMRLALKRHSDRARIAYYLVTDEKTKPGGIKEKLDDQGRIELLQDMLVLWHNLFSSPQWRDDTAKHLWEEYIAKIKGYETPQDTSEDLTDTISKETKKKNREKFYNVAKELAQNTDLRETLHKKWKETWEADDAEWKKRLRRFKDWVLPRGRSGHDGGIRKVGGLSLTRLATLTEFRRQLQVGYFTRLRPDGKKEEIKERFGQSTLNALEHMREQRVKQLASRIVEAALGIGSEDSKHWEKGKRPRQRIAEPRFSPCHAIVIENLTNYRPEETRTRRENKNLMIWSSSRIKKYLSESCELYGLYLREVSPSYSSLIDSRTGAPGLRCQDVPIKGFMRSPFWKKEVKRAEEKLEEGRGDARDRYLIYLSKNFIDKTEEDWKTFGSVRIPLQGGEVFVSSNPLSPAARGIQVDLNAAANIGLRAITDPDWPGRWWYIPCDSTSFKPVKERVEGSAAVDLSHPLREPSTDPEDGDSKEKKKPRRRGGGKSKEVINLWRDISSYPLKVGDWKETSHYWNEVRYKVVDILKTQTQDRIDRLWGKQNRI